MATYNTPFYLTQDPARANTSRLAAPNIASGDVEFAVIPHTLIAHVGGDIINLCVLPAGCIPIPSLSKVSCSGDPSTGGLTVNVGTAADPDGWMAGITITGSAPVEATSGTPPAWQEQTPLAPDPNSTSAVVFATMVATPGITAGPIMYFTLAYKRNKG